MAKKVKVLLAGTIAGNGGIQSHLKWLAKALSQEGIEVIIFSWDRSPISVEELQKLRDFWNDKVHLINLTDKNQEKSTLIISRLQKLTEVSRKIKDIDPDIYLVVGTSWQAFVAPILASTPAKLIFHEVMSGTGKPWQDSRWCVRWFFDEVVAQSPTVTKNFQTSFSWKHKILAIPALPEPLEITARLPQAVVKKVELGKVKAALFSRLVPHKRALWLVQQWDSFKDVIAELNIHGIGPEEELIRDYIASQGIGDRVKCFGRYPEGQAYVDLLSSYDLTLLPTVGAEGAPLVLLESMACGVPFVTYGVGGLPDYRVNNPNVIVVPPEPWITDQAQHYAVPGMITPVELSRKEWKTLYKQYSSKPLPQTIAFINGVRLMAYRLAQGEINQAELQNFYFKNYSYEILRKSWLSYLYNLLKMP